MGRPRKFRKIRFRSEASYFKPRGIPMSSLEEIELEHDEVEAMRLCDLKDSNMEEAGEKMQISKSTVHRLLNSAHKKIAEAIVEGKAIKIVH